MYHDDWHGSMDGWWWIPMSLMMLAFWGGLLWLAVTFIRQQSRKPAHGGIAPAPAPAPVPLPAPLTPQEILAGRLARGEIEPEDYRARLDALTHKPSS